MRSRLAAGETKRPLTLGLGEGSEMPQPLAVTIVAGLSFSMLESLGLVPAIYL